MAQNSDVKGSTVQSQNCKIGNHPSPPKYNNNNQRQQTESILILGCRLRPGQVIISFKNGLAVSEDVYNEITWYATDQDNVLLSLHVFPYKHPNQEINTLT